MSCKKVLMLSTVVFSVRELDLPSFNYFVALVKNRFYKSNFLIENIVLYSIINKVKKTMAKHLWLTLLLTVFINFSFAQFEDYEQHEIKNDTIVKKRDSLRVWNRTVFGGTFNLALGTVTMVEISPTVGFYVTKWLMPGVFTNFMYVKSKLANYEELRWGPGAFVEAFPIEFLVLHSEYSLDHVYDNLNYKYIWTSRVNLGLGYRQKLGKKSMVNYMILFNVLKNPFYPPYEYRILFLF